MRVLYVDDDPIMASAVVRMLDSEGFDCDTADLGKTAIDLANRNKYDIVLLDVMLPDIDGYEVIKRLRTAGLRTPVLLQSGLVDRENDFEGIWLGASEYLLKPFNKTELIESIEAVLLRTANKVASEASHPSDPSIPEAEVEDQRRRHRRFETVQPGTILCNGGIDCLIMDLSYGGAALQLMDPDVDLPETFDLQLQSGSMLRCNVRWRSGERVGVQSEARISDEVLGEVLTQNDGQPAPAPVPDRPEPMEQDPERTEAVADARVQSGPMPDPKTVQVPPQSSEADVPRDLQRMDPPSPRSEAEDTAEPEPERQREAPPREEPAAETALETPDQSGPQTPDLNGQPDAASDRASEQSAVQQAVPGGARGSEQREAGAEALGRPAGPASQPPQPAHGTAPKSLPANDLDPARADNGRVFTVERGTRLVAESCECEEIVVDGELEAAARACRLRLGREGRFAGSAEVEIAEIRGHYEGKLVVTGRLVIFAGATVSGTTRYRQIVVEAGGALVGQAQLLPKAAAAPAGFDADEQAAKPPMPARAARA